MAFSGIAALLDSTTKSQRDVSGSVGRLNDQINLLIAADESPRTVATADCNDPHETQSASFREEFARLREALLLPNAEREKQADARTAALAATMLADAAAAIEQRRWLDADRMIGEVETMRPEIPQAAEMRFRFAQAHDAAEAETLASTRSEIESDMSRGDWDEAQSRAERLLIDYPANAVAERMLQRVKRERDIYTESSVQRLFEDIRHDSDRRQWRRSLSHAQTLLQKFPTHERADRIRQQLHTLQENAEIEERHECEARISDLVKSRRFEDAIRSAEDLLQRFPTSPQAETMQKLIPRLRERAEDEQSSK